MHVLVQCPSCRRQSDAGDLEIGRKFHCLCGDVLEVPRVRARNAAVVRCSSCGGPRTADAPNCGFCGAVFTIHELQLHTICPSCMARIVDRAKFCHNCGTAILVQGKSGVQTKLRCPVCGPERRLDSRSFGEPPVSLMECQICAGLWLGRETFELLADRMRDRVTPAGELPGGAPRAAARKRTTVQRGPLYRRCPRCEQMMARRNFARRSGVIIDSCREHGIWFDAGELHSLLQWIRRGGQKQAQQRERGQARAASRAARTRGATSRIEKMACSVGTPRFAASGADSSPLMDVLGVFFKGWR